MRLRIAYCVLRIASGAAFQLPRQERTRFTFHVSRFTNRYAIRNPQSAIITISALALILRLWSLDGYGLWYDEVASIEIARRGPLAILTDRFGGMLVQTPLHYLMVWLTSLPIDPAATSVLVRLPSVIAGALTPLVVFGIGREMFGRAQGLLAALFVALSAVHIGHSQDVRPYALLIFTTALSIYTLLRAEREGSRKAWVAFAASTVAALYISYFSLTLFMPALLPYLAWVIYKLWSHRRVARRGVPSARPYSEAVLVAPSIKYLFLAGLALALAAIPIALDVLQLQRNLPNLNLLSPDYLLGQVTLLVTTNMKLGAGGMGEVYAQWILFALALLGVYSAIRARRFGALALCLSLIIIPGLLLALAKTTNPVFQRYAVFVMPFYFLLISNGVMRFRIMDFGFWRIRGHKAQNLTKRSQLSTQHSALSTLIGTKVALLLIAALFIYSSPDGHRRFSFLPDYRGAAHYLSRAAGPDDLIIMADEPALGAEVVNFYWRDKPPAPIFDARDPRLFSPDSRAPKGTIFWVVSFFQNNPEFMRDLPSADPAWSDGPTYLERIVIVRDDRHSVTPGMQTLTGEAQARLPAFQPVLTLQGVLPQARGELDAAAGYYSQAGIYYPQLGAEFLSSAQGFAARGDHAKAWREAIASKFMDPGNPDLHALMSQELLAIGYPAESHAEAEIADALRR